MPYDTAAPAPNRDQAVSALRALLPQDATLYTSEVYRRQNHNGTTYTAHEVYAALSPTSSQLTDISRLAAAATGNRYVDTSTHHGVRGNFGAMSPHLQLRDELSMALYGEPGALRHATPNLLPTLTQAHAATQAPTASLRRRYR